MLLKLLKEKKLVNYKIFGLVVFLMLAFAPGIIGSLFGAGFPAGLILPSFTPPGYIFGIVWPILYVMIGLAGWRAWFNCTGKSTAPAYMTYAAQLILNGAWSAAFWAFGSPVIALCIILLLLYSIYWNIKEFTVLDKTAGYLLVPYFLWVVFATALNIGIVILN